MWDFQDRVSIILKIIGCCMLGWLFFVAHGVILLVSHSAVIAIRDGITMDAAITPLHSSFMADDFIGSYYIMRETLFAEIPYYSFFDGILGHRSALSYGDLFYDTVKAAVAGVVSYLLCRFNRLLSSLEHPILFWAVTSFWSSISVFGSLLLVTWLRTFPQKQNIIICVGILLLAPLFLTLISMFSLWRFGTPLSFKRVFGENILGLLNGMLDSLYVFLISCFSFDVLHHYISDGFTLIMMIFLIAGIASYLYNYVKQNVLMKI